MFAQDLLERLDVVTAHLPPADGLVELLPKVADDLAARPAADRKEHVC